MINDSGILQYQSEDVFLTKPDQFEYFIRIEKGNKIIEVILSEKDIKSNFKPLIQYLIQKIKSKRK